jgi:hypothetical protein
MSPFVKLLQRPSRLVNISAIWSSDSSPMSEIETEIIAGGGIFTPTESAKLYNVETLVG